MSNYRGPATLTIAGQEPRTGTATLHAAQKEGVWDWRGSFIPDDGAPVNAGGTATLATTTWSGEVLVNDFRFNGHLGTAFLIGQDMPPF